MSIDWLCLSRKSHNYNNAGTYVSRRRFEQDRAKRVPVSVTLDKELYDFIEGLIDRRQFKDRTHAVNAALDYLRWTLQNNPLAYFGPRKPVQDKLPVTPPQYQKKF